MLKELEASRRSFLQCAACLPAGRGPFPFRGRRSSKDDGAEPIVFVRRERDGALDPIRRTHHSARHAVAA